jgi:MYXO-CTERM domain-containing protein
MNNVIVGTGQAPAGSTPIQNQPPSGWTNNVVTTGSVNYFIAPTGTNPSFVPAASASNLIGQGMSGNGAPANDLGFDPKCLVKRTPVMVGQVARASTWQYDIDIDYIKSIGGVAKCFNPGMRSGSPDIGAYKAGAVAAATPGSCVPPPIGGSGGMGGMSATGGAAGTGVGAGMGGTLDAGGAAGASGVVNAGGTLAAGGVAADAGATATGGAPAGAGGVGAGGFVMAAGGTPSSAAGESGSAFGGSAPMGTGGVGNGGAGGTVPAAGSPGTGGSVGVGGSSTGAVGSGGNGDAGEAAGCGCRLAPSPGRSSWVAVLGLFGLGVVTVGRRRRGRRSVA